MADVAENIKIQRLNKGLNQAQLAEKLSITTQTLSSWEDGSSFPDIKMLEQLARELGIEIESLIYPHSHNGTKQESKSPLSFKFILLSVILYSILLVFGGGLFAIPILKSIVGGGITEEFILVVYWGLILLVGYIGLCMYLIQETFRQKLQTVDSISIPKIYEYALWKPEPLKNNLRGRLSRRIDPYRSCRGHYRLTLAGPAETGGYYGGHAEETRSRRSPGGL